MQEKRPASYREGPMEAKKEGTLTCPHGRGGLPAHWASSSLIVSVLPSPFPHRCSSLFSELLDILPSTPTLPFLPN